MELYKKPTIVSNYAVRGLLPLATSLVVGGLKLAAAVGLAAGAVVAAGAPATVAAVAAAPKAVAAAEAITGDKIALPAFALQKKFLLE